MDTQKDALASWNYAAGEAGWHIGGHWTAATPEVGTLVISGEVQGAEALIARAGSALLDAPRAYGLPSPATVTVDLTWCIFLCSQCAVSLLRFAFEAAEVGTRIEWVAGPDSHPAHKLRIMGACTVSEELKLPPAEDVMST